MRGSSVILFIILSLVLCTNFILRAFNEPNSFKVIIAFTLMYFAGVIPLIFLQVKGYEPISWFNELSSNSFIYILVGIGGLVFAGYASTWFFSYPYSAYVAAFVSGIIMFYTLFETKSILVPIIIHGTFNSIVVYQEIISQYLSVSSSMFVPILDIGVSDLSSKASEMVLQYTFVAPAEEFLKVGLVSALLLQSSYGWLKHKWVAVGITVLIWIGWHAYLAYV